VAIIAAARGIGEAIAILLKRDSSTGDLEKRSRSRRHRTINYSTRRKLLITADCSDDRQ
jgi:hypothetical protein